MQELREHYRTADKQGSLPIFSANLVAIPPLYTVKYIQAKKHFLITPQNQTTPERWNEKSNITEIVALAFNGILQNIFQC